MFIVFEGLDGCGKSSQICKLKEYLESKGNSVWVTAEPTESEIGKLIRKIQRKESIIPTNTLKYLYIADRIYHAEEIKLHLDKGDIVICDRFWYSSVAYQDVDSNIYYGNSAYTLNGMLLDLPIPNHIFYIDTSIEECLNRIGTRDSVEIFENKKYLTKVKEIYDNIFNSGLSYYKTLGRWDESKGLEKVLDEAELIRSIKIHRVNGDKSIEEVFSEIKEKINIKTY